MVNRSRIVFLQFNTRPYLWRGFLNFTTMTQQQIKSFLFEIGGVCARHRIGCFVGLWFAGRGHDEIGISAKNQHHDH